VVAGLRDVENGEGRGGLAAGERERAGAALERRQALLQDVLRAGAAPDPVTKARATPIYQTTSYVFDNADHAASAWSRSASSRVRTCSAPAWFG
jgi:hypothetical protein